MGQIAENQENGQQPKSLMTKFAHNYGVEPAKMQKTLIDTAFRQRDGQITNEQMMALLIVADQYGLNPFTKEIYAFPDKNKGIVPIVGIDGWSRIINQHDQFDGMHFEAAEEQGQIDEHQKPCPAWITCTIYRKDRRHPISVTEYLDEVYRPPFQKDGKVFPGPWQTHTKRFLRHKAMIQCARIAFGFTGIYDQDEGERVIEGEVIRNEANPTPQELCQQAADENADSVVLIKEGIEEGDLFKAAEAWFELDAETQQALWLAPSKGGVFTTEERATIKTSEFRKAFYGENAA